MLKNCTIGRGWHSLPKVSAEGYFQEIKILYFEHPPTLQIIGQNNYFPSSITALPPHSITHWYSDHTPGPLLLSLSIDHPVTCLRSLIFHQNDISSSLIFSIPSKKRPLKKGGLVNQNYWESVHERWSVPLLLFIHWSSSYLSGTINLQVRLYPIKIINLRAPIKIITVASNLVQLHPLHLSRVWFYAHKHKSGEEFNIHTCFKYIDFYSLRMVRKTFQRKKLSCQRWHWLLYRQSYT